jgi:hypothetical protein
MKQKIYFMGLVAVLLMSTGAIFKVNHWPAAAIMMTVGTIILVLLFLPAALINHYRAEGNKQNRSLYIVTWITCFVVFTGMLFKIQHWPYAGYALIIALPFPYVVFLPVFLLVTSRNRNFNVYNTVFVLLLLALNSVFSALLALNVSKETINDSYSISRNYCRMESALDDLNKISRPSAVNLKIDEVLRITNEYKDMILKKEGMTREVWANDPGNLRIPENQNIAAGILAANGEMPAGIKLYKSLRELVELMSKTSGYEETARDLPAILGLEEENSEDPATAFSFRNIIIPLSWSMIYLDGLQADLMMIKVAGR